MKTEIKKPIEQTIRAMNFWANLFILITLGLGIAGAWNHWLWVSTGIFLFFSIALISYGTGLEKHLIEKN